MTGSPRPGRTRIGRSVAGYEILGELGRGGMGVVYKARQLKLNRLVALKMILAGGHAGPASWTASAREAEAVARLQHPNIVQIYEVGETRRPAVLLAGVRATAAAWTTSSTACRWPPARRPQLVETLAAGHARGPPAAASSTAT